MCSTLRNVLTSYASEEYSKLRNVLTSYASEEYSKLRKVLTSCASEEYSTLRNVLTSCSSEEYSKLRNVLASCAREVYSKHRNVLASCSSEEYSQLEECIDVLCYWGIVYFIFHLTFSRQSFLRYRFTILYSYVPELPMKLDNKMRGKLRTLEHNRHALFRSFFNPGNC